MSVYHEVPTEVTTPRRIQRRRTKGWRMPEGAVYVGRPTRWGNPYKPGDDHPWYHPGEVLISRQDAVDLYRRSLSARLIEDAHFELAGRDLACWCPLDVPCHADVLLEIVNGGDR